MKKYKIGIIGGSGFYSIKSFADSLDCKLYTVNSCGVELENLKKENIDYYFLPRHGKRHELLPHNINYEQNLNSFKELNVDMIISFCTVGSINKNHPPGKYVIPLDVIDFTQNRTGSKLVLDNKHLDIEPIFSPDLVGLFDNVFINANVDFSNVGILGVIEGPRFATLAEQKMYKILGVDFLNMTQMPEIYLAKVFGIPYISLCHITDFTKIVDKDFDIYNAESLEIFNSNTDKIDKILKSLDALLSSYDIAINKNESNESFV